MLLGGKLSGPAMYPPRDAVPWIIITIAIGLYVHIRLDELTPRKPWRWGDAYRNTRRHPLINIVGALLAMLIIAIGLYL